ncbi:MAG: hypothetical protein AUK47_24535 [Deltaproteobacteria bacterium CG2_30_63_29]|nr:MAG: hypothetical protein AUK47_24535 [Deltaproteobacteria bacterium CG2_30_63_29]
MHRQTTLLALVAFCLCSFGCSDEPKRQANEDLGDTSQDQGDSDLGDLGEDTTSDSLPDQETDATPETTDLAQDEQETLVPPAQWSALGGPTSAPFVGADADLLWAAGDTLQLFSGSWSVPALGADVGLPVSTASNRDNPAQRLVLTDKHQLLTSSNGGATWTANQFRAGTVDLLAAPSSPADVLYAHRRGSGLFRSQDALQTWQLLLAADAPYANALSVAADDSAVFLARGSALLRSEDRGQSWVVVLDVAPSTVTQVHVDPLDATKVFAGVAGDHGAIYSSADAGDTWAPMDTIAFTSIHTLITSSNDANYGLAGVWGGGVYETADAGQSWTELDAPTRSASALMLDGNDLVLADRTAPKLYKSSGPVGARVWTTLFDAGPDYYRPIGATKAPNADIYYVSLFRKDGGPMTGALFKVDHGVPTGPLTLPRMPVVVAVDPVDADIVYTALHAADGGVYKSVDGGANWTLISGLGSGLPPAPAVGFNGLLIDPTNPDRVYLLGGSDAIFFGNTVGFTGTDPAIMNTLYRSEDAGATWVSLNDGSFGANSGMLKGLALHPNAPTVLFAASLNGVFRSLDDGATWTEIGAALPFQQTAGVQLNADGSVILIPTLGGGLYVGNIDPVTYDVTWQLTDRLQTAVERVDIQTYLGKPDSLIATAYPGGVYLSSDRGATWGEHNFGLPTFEVSDTKAQGRYQLVVAPSDPQRLYLAIPTRGLYRSTDAGATWVSAFGFTQTLRGADVRAIGVDPIQANRVWVGTEEGLYSTLDGGLNWALVDAVQVRALLGDAAGRILAGTASDELLALPAASAPWEQLPRLGGNGLAWLGAGSSLSSGGDFLAEPGKLFVNVFPGGLFASEDQGESWVERSLGLGDCEVLCLARVPGTAALIAGTTRGVAHSEDEGQHWVLDEATASWVFGDLAFDPTNPTRAFATATSRAAWRSTPRNLYQSEDAGRTWAPVDLGGVDDVVGFALDPTGRVFVATEAHGVWLGAGSTWTEWNQGLTQTLPAKTPYGGSKPIAVSEDLGAVVFGSAGGGVFWRSL